MKPKNLKYITDKDLIYHTQDTARRAGNPDFDPSFLNSMADVTIKFPLSQKQRESVLEILAENQDYLLKKRDVEYKAMVDKAYDFAKFIEKNIPGGLNEY